ncbi:MAG: signal peptidase I [Defluviitaleaceae bacterium]|nr:signal peptidase I [Defluviitaleaceae bacterium]
MFCNRIQNPILRGAAEWLVSIGLAVLLFFVVRGFLFRTAHVDGGSMSPTLIHGDMLILNRLTYFISSPKVGDIVAFLYTEESGEYYIKRIVAAPGDVVDLRDGFFYVNEELLNDDFSSEETLVYGDVEFPVTIAKKNYFVLGDDRNGSQDSRFVNVGTVSAEKIVGRANFRIWPFDRVGRVQ